MKKEKGQQTYYMHPLFEVTIEDIFNKHDMLMNKVLGYEDFKGFCDCIGRELSEEEFKNEYLGKYQSSDQDSVNGVEGLTLNGFKDFF